MGPTLASLLKLQNIEQDLSHVRRRLRSKQNAVKALQLKIEDLNRQLEVLRQNVLARQAEAGKHELELKSREEDISRFRGALNTAKTNKEYAAILTQINTFKADNSKLEDEILKVMQGVDAARADQEKLNAQIEAEQKRLDQVNATNAEEITKLNTMVEELQTKRAEAAKLVEAKALSVFDRVAGSHEGEAMAAIEITDAKRGEYICSGCYMSLTAEHYNALLSRDEIRQCDNCKRILYLEPQNEISHR